MEVSAFNPASDCQRDPASMEEEDEWPNFPSLKGREFFHFPMNIILVNKFLSLGSVIPFIGTVPAIIKVALGIIHTLISICCLPFSFSKAQNHLKYALNNIKIGILEAIPLVGTIVAMDNAAFFWQKFLTPLEQKLDPVVLQDCYVYYKG